MRRVITTAGSEDKLRFCRSIGADHAISYHDDWPAAVRDVAADGVHLILDNMGAKYLDDHVQLLAMDGALVIIGMQGGRKGTLDLASLARTRGLITANLLRARPVEEKAAICRGLVQNVWPLIADDTIKQPPLTVFPSGRGRRSSRSPRVGQQHRQDHPLGRALGPGLAFLRTRPRMQSDQPVRSHVPTHKATNGLDRGEASPSPRGQ